MGSIARDWEGETAFILAGGASVKDLDLSPLKGRRVIAINSAVLAWSAADILFFADARWWSDPAHNWKADIGAFAGRFITTSGGGPPGVTRLMKVDPATGIASSPTQLALARTSVTGAINLAVHLGCRRVVLLGVDGCNGKAGERHHHGAAYPWPFIRGSFDLHAAEFKAVAPSIERAGVEVINANPASAIDVWPRMSFEAALSMLQRVPAKSPVVVTGMYGIGDNVHQRAVIRELMKTREVWLRTYYPALYHDLVADGLNLIMETRLPQRMRTGGQGSRGRQPANAEELRITYTPEMTRRAGSLLAAQFVSAGLSMPEKPDFSLPVKDEWRKAAKDLLAKHNKAGLPVMVYRPIVLNKVWECPSRSPDPVAYAKLYQAIRGRFFTVSVCDLTNSGEHIVGDEQDADLKLHKGELDFETLAGLFAEADLIFANPGFAPILAQAVGTPNIVVYGGNESFRTTNAVGVHLAPTLAIEPIKPCECFAKTHDCDKRIDIDAAMGKVVAFAREHGAAPRTLIFGTAFVDSEDKAKLIGQWQKLHRHLNPGCDLLLVDSASPVKWQAEPGVKVHDFGDNIGHLARKGRDGWGRAFCYGLQAAIDGGYDYVVHIEGDSLARRPMAEEIALMVRERMATAVVPVKGTKSEEKGWAETGLMIFDVEWLKSSGFIGRYDWPNRKSKPEPELVIAKMLYDPDTYGGAMPLPWRAYRGDKGQITAENADSFDWITHCAPEAFDAFMDAAMPAEPKVKLNFGCGENRLDGWQNFDADVDITKPLRFDSASADFIFAEHVVEHVDYRQALAFFAECRRVLKPGGVIRIAVPSLENIWKRGDQAYFDFARKWAPSADLRGAMHAIINAHGHKAIWTQSLLEACLFYAGFEDITPCEPGKSKHRDLVGAEGHGRVIGEHFNWIETAVVEGRA